MFLAGPRIRSKLRLARGMHQTRPASAVVIEKDFDLPAPCASRPNQLTVTFVVKNAAQVALVVVPMQSRVFAAIPEEPIGFQLRHGVRHNLVVTEEYERATDSLATKPLDFWPLPRQVVGSSNNGTAMLPFNLALERSRVKVRPNSLTQVLNREGVIALPVKDCYERSLDFT